MLLIGAGLMLTSFARLRAVDPGFTVRSCGGRGCRCRRRATTTPRRRGSTQQLSERAARESGDGAIRAGFSDAVRRRQRGRRVHRRGRAAAAARRAAASPQLGSVSPGYFQTMGIPLLRGRDVALTDTRDGPGVVVVNQTLAEREWPGQDPIGKRHRARRRSRRIPTAWLTVVGVVGDSKRDDLQAGPRPAIYLSVNTFTLPFMGAWCGARPARRAVADGGRGRPSRALDRSCRSTEVETLERMLERATGQPRFRATLDRRVRGGGAAAGGGRALRPDQLHAWRSACRRSASAWRSAPRPAQVGRLVARPGLGLAARRRARPRRRAGAPRGSSKACCSRSAPPIRVVYALLARCSLLRIAAPAPATCRRAAPCASIR